MNNLLKRKSIVTLVGVFAISTLAMPIFAASTGTTVKKNPQQKGLTPNFQSTKMKDHGNFKFGKFGTMSKPGEFQELSDEALTKIAEKKGITLVALKAEMDAKKAEMDAKREAELAKMAEKKGITLVALKAEMAAKKAEMDAKREAELAKMAKEQGITVDQLKAKMATKKDFKGDRQNLKNKNHMPMFGEPKELTDAELVKMAEKKGITVDALKAQIATKKAEMDAKREAELTKMAEKKGITLVALKAEMAAKKAEMDAKREAELTKMAKDQGITVDQLKAKMPTHKSNKQEQRNNNRGFSKNKGFKNK